MEISAALAADLADLTTALCDPDVDLESTVRSFGSGACAAIDSLFGITTTVVTDGDPFTFTTVEPTAATQPVMASLLVPLPLLTTVQAGSHLVLYAARPGAFVDLSADLAFALDVDLASLPVDRHLQLPGPDLASRLSEAATANRAVGVLVDRGRTPDEARAELRRAGASDGGSGAAARAVLASVATACEPDG